MKKLMKKASAFLKEIFGWGMMICLFAGGLTFFGYVVALIVGGDAAALICTFIYKKFFPVIVYISSVLVMLGLVAMYLNGEFELSAKKK